MTPEITLILIILAVTALMALCSRRRRSRSKCRRKQSAGAVLCVRYPNCRDRIF